MKHYHYIVKWSEGEGWRIDPETESANFPNGTIYDEQEGWQFGYLGEGEFNGKEEELSQALTNLLDTANTKERKGEISSDLLCQVSPIFGSVAVERLSNYDNPKILK
jgi:hypothetical protein